MTASPSLSQSSWSFIDDSAFDEDLENVLLSSSVSTLHHTHNRQHIQQQSLAPFFALPDENDILRSRILDLERKNVILQDQMDEHQYTSFNQSEEISTVRRRLNDLEEENTYLKAGLDPSRQALDNEVRRLKIKLGEKKDEERRGVLEEIVKRIEENHHLEILSMDEVKSVLGDDDNVRTIGGLKKLALDQNTRISKLTKELNENENELTEKTLLNHELVYINKNLETQNAKLSEEVKTLGGNEEKLKNYKSSIANIKKKYKKQLAQKELELKDDFLRKQDEIKAENKKIKENKKAIKEDQTELAYYKKKNERLSKLIDKTKLENEQLNEELDKSREEINSLVDKVNLQLKISSEK
ncbi:uncharacterized protein L201_005739 [Kwoniella dendrophila CBS 6074]|uniref:Uncharacterized protein n=1 Tax=Kwoniella dendrophila CBS 6074 TaxID=1295534 RepID=A0AAX4JZU6_9TREE